ncbi:MAG: thiamine pyrophosphate-dependent enzyme, partial [Halanaerobium sp.]|nr:thiamine pyrophosphate-dependent enzyme [Halanaerobium sp.]
AARLIETASRPVILFGRGARNSLQELNRLADLRGCALINTLPARGTFTTKDPLYVGGLGHGGSQAAEKVLAEADLVLTFGATWWPMGYVPREPRIIQFDAAKENIGMSHPIELGIVGDIKMSLNMLLEQLVERHDENWLKTVHQAKQAWVAGLNEEVSSQDIPLYPQQAIATISRYTAANEIICLDSGDNVIWFSRFFDATCRDILVSGTWRTMGYALPAALAAKINNQEEPVTCLTGDGGFAMTMPEVLTAVRYNLPVRIIILNNSTLAMEKNRMTVTQMTPYEMDQTNPDFIKYAEACNIDAFRVQGPESLTGVLQETSYLTNTTLIEVPVKNIVSSGTRLEREPASKMV